MSDSYHLRFAFGFASPHCRGCVSINNKDFGEKTSRCTLMSPSRDGSQCDRGTFRYHHVLFGASALIHFLAYRKRRGEFLFNLRK